MTIHVVKGNLIKDIVSNKIQGHIIQGCNAQGGMGAGFALQVRNQIPTAFDAYMKVHYEKGLSLGMAIPARLSEQTVFWNLITQERYGRKPIKYVSYDGIDDSLRNMRRMIDNRQDAEIPNKLYFPLIGCGLANGQWSTVSSIIETHFFDFDKTLYEFAP